MKAIQYSSVTPTIIDNEKAKRVAARVVIGKADGANNFCMRVFEIDAGGFTPLHRHAWEHEMFFHAGRGEVLIDGKRNPVSAGSAVLVPGEAEHQIRNGGDERLVVVCLVPGTAPEL